MPLSNPTRNISPELLAAIAEQSSTLTACILITPLTGDVVGFTCHDEDVEFDGETYYADPGLSATEMVAAIDYSVDNLEITGAIDDDLVVRADVEAGVYDDAEYTIFLIDFENPDYGEMILQKGTLGETEVVEDKFTFELRSQSQKLQQVIGEVLQPTCRNLYGDARCALDLEAGTHPTLAIPYKFAAQAILAVVSRFSFTFTNGTGALPAGYFEGGKLLWTDGDNNLQQSEVKSHTKSGTTHTIVLQEPTYRAFTAGDEFTIYKGCKKRFEDCFDVDNVINMSAEIYLPGWIETQRRP
jgi:uncharacterized phage protein (TIGR02218 family)